jgi:hypothetical protein
MEEAREEEDRNARKICDGFDRVTDSHHSRFSGNFNRY